MFQVNFKIQILLIILTLIFLFILIYINRNPTVCTIEPMIQKIRNDLIKIDPRAQSLQFFPADESYTEDKQKIYICLKDENGEYYPYNQLMHVAVHELSHAVCPIVDEQHVTPEWNAIFKNLLTKATELGLYNPNEQLIKGYCKRH